MYASVVHFVLAYVLGALSLQSTRLCVRIVPGSLGCWLIYRGLKSLREVSSLPLMECFGPLCTIGTMHFLNLILIERYELPGIKHGRQRFDIRGAASILNNGRFIGTPREVKGLGTWPQDGTGWVQRWLPARLRNNSKWAWIIERAVTVLIFYAIKEKLPYPPYMPSDIHPTKANLIRRLGDVSGREYRLRAFLAGKFIFDSWASLDLAYETLAAITVALNLYKPEDWPPLFGSVTEAYTIRRFWSKFWHRLVYRAYRNFSRLIADWIPGIRRCSCLHWMITSFLIFTISGLNHMVISWYLKYRCGLLADLYFYWYQFGGIALEEAVMYVAKDRLPQNRLLGYVWVYLWFFWCTPKYFFPQWKWNCLPLS